MSVFVVASVVVLSVRLPRDSLLAVLRFVSLWALALVCWSSSLAVVVVVGVSQVFLPVLRSFSFVASSFLQLFRSVPLQQVAVVPWWEW